MFARAAERQHKADQRPEGLSLTELQEIAKASGIDPAHVAAAVADIRGGGGEPEPVTWFGANMEPRASRTIPADLNEDQWAEVVKRLRRTFGSKGSMGRLGAMREWTSGPTSKLHVTAQKVDGGTRIEMETSRAAETQGTVGALTGLAVLFAALLIGGAVTGSFSAMLMLTLLTAAAIAVTFGAMRVAYGSWSKKRSGQFDALLDQIELIALASSSETAGEATAASPRLDLDALAETPETDASERRRQRDRA